MTRKPRKTGSGGNPKAISKEEHKYIYCIRKPHIEESLCGKDTGLRWMYNCLVDTKTGTVPVCEDCVGIAELSELSEETKEETK